MKMFWTCVECFGSVFYAAPVPSRCAPEVCFYLREGASDAADRLAKASANSVGLATAAAEVLVGACTGKPSVLGGLRVLYSVHCIIF